MIQLIDITLLFFSYLKRYACCKFLHAKTDSSICQKRKKRSSETMKTSLATLIFCLFLALAFCQAGLADSRDAGVSNDLPLLEQWGKTPNLSAFLLFADKDFTLVQFPFRKSWNSNAFGDLKAFFPFLDAVLSAKDLLWTEISKWNPTPSFSRTQRSEAGADTFSKAFDSKNLTAEDRMGISLHHGVGNRKAWNVSLQLGIAIQNDFTVLPGHALSDGFFPKLGMDLNDQSEDLFDQLRTATPFIGFGISCRF